MRCFFVLVFKEYILWRGRDKGKSSENPVSYYKKSILCLISKKDSRWSDSINNFNRFSNVTTTTLISRTSIGPGVKKSRFNQVNKLFIIIVRCQFNAITKSILIDRSSLVAFKFNGSRNGTCLQLWEPKSGWLEQTRFTFGIASPNVIFAIIFSEA